MPVIYYILDDDCILEVVDKDTEVSEQLLTLRPYQESIAQKSLQGANDIILLPTGSGKTYVAIKVIENHLSSREGECQYITS